MSCPPRILDCEEGIAIFYQFQDAQLGTPKCFSIRKVVDSGYRTRCEQNSPFFAIADSHATRCRQRSILRVFNSCPLPAEATFVAAALRKSQGQRITLSRETGWCSQSPGSEGCCSRMSMDGLFTML